MLRPLFARAVGLHRAFLPEFVATRSFWGWRRYPLSSLERYVDRRLWEVDREMNRALEDLDRWSPFRFPSRWQPSLWRWRTGGRDPPVEVAEDGSRKLVFKLDVSHFKPDEVRVTQGDGVVIVRAKHEEESGDGGKVYREYVKEFALPEDADPLTIRSYLSVDGLLRIEAQLPAIEAPTEKEIPVQKMSKDPENKK